MLCSMVLTTRKISKKNGRNDTGPSKKELPKVLPASKKTKRYIVKEITNRFSSFTCALLKKLLVYCQESSTFLIPSYSAGVAYTKTNIHLSVGERVGYLLL